MRLIELKKTQDLFKLKQNDTIFKKNLEELVKCSKKENSEFWSGKDFRINNTPQQGINWVGDFSTRDYSLLKGVLVKVYSNGEYPMDGWVEGENTLYRYSYRRDKNVVDFQATPNMVLFQQKRFKYKVLLFTESEHDSTMFIFQGFFTIKESITQSAHPHVVMERLS